MTKQLSPEMIEKVARHLVKQWENLESPSHSIRTLGLSPSVIEAWEKDARQLLGGEELYLACKEFLKGVENDQSNR